MKKPLSPITLAALALAASLSGSAKAEVIYQISPYFSARGYDGVPLQVVKNRLAEIRELGADVVYLMPITESAEAGQGYDTVDHYSISKKLGTADDLRALVQEAHRQHLKVMLDVALNHVSNEHAYVRDVEARGSASPYASFFQSQGDAAQPFNNFLHLTTRGKGHFAYYFWDELFNLNYSSDQARHYALDVLTHWVRDFDVDGYRLDAAWGPSARWRDFYPTVSSTLRAIKPSVILLAEDCAGYPTRYQGTGHPHLHGSGFDLAYDWNNSDPNWLSQWSFEKTFAERNSEASAREFIHALSFTQDAEVGVLRFIQNNDTASFNDAHNEAETNFATVVEFMLPGALLISHGQEVGTSYSQWDLPSFDPSRSMKSYGLARWNFHQALIRLRNSSDALSHGKLEVAPTSAAPGTVHLFRRSPSESATIDLDFKTHSVILNGKPLLDHGKPVLGA